MSSPVIVPATGRHTASLIFLHGLGDTGNGWSSGLESVKQSHVKLICPTAPIIPVTLNGGLRMNAWFDLKSLDPNGAEDENGIKAAAEKVRKLIQDEVKSGIPMERIVLGGFSQGGALAIYTALTSDSKLGGLIALSSWLPMHKKFPWRANLMKPPTIQCHGQQDPLVLYSIGAMTSAILKAALPTYEFKSYPGLQHSSSAQELDDVKAFLNQVIP